MHDNNNDHGGGFISPRDYVAVLKRRRGTIAATFVAVMAVGTVVTLLTKPVYRATARLLIDSPTQSVSSVDAADPYAQLMAGSHQYSLETQMQLLQGDGIMRQAASRLGGVTRPPATAIILGPQVFSVSVDNPKDTQIVEVTTEGPDAQKSATVADTLVNTYLTTLVTMQDDPLHHADQFTSTEAAKARLSLQAAEGAMRDFESRHALSDIDKDQNAQIAALAALNTQYQTTLAQLAQAQSQVRATQQQMAAVPKTALDVINPAADLMVQQTQTQLATLVAQRAALAAQYAPTSQQIEALNAQIRVLHSQEAALIKTAPARNARRNTAFLELQNQLSKSQVEAAGLASEVRVIADQRRIVQARLGQFAAWAAVLARLDRQVTITKSNYMTLAQKEQDLHLREQMHNVSAHLVEAASVPTMPDRPKKAQNLLFAALLGLFFGVCMALLQEFADDRLHTLEEADRLLQTPILGRIPSLEADTVSARAALPMPEAYRDLRTNLNFLAMESPFKTLAITAASPGESASLTVAHLARAFALDGKRVLAIDGNMHSPAQDALLEPNAGPGLADVLAGTWAFNDAVLPTEVENLFLMPSGTPPANPTELLGSAAMAHFLKAASARADVILFDLPSMQDSSDARVLAAQVDGTLLLVDCGQTKKVHAQRARTLLSHSRIRLLGIIWGRDCDSGMDSSSWASQRSTNNSLQASLPLHGNDQPSDSNKTLVMERSVTGPTTLVPVPKGGQPEGNNFHE